MHSLLHPVPLTLKQDTPDLHLCWRLPDTHGHVWVSFFFGGGHCSFLLDPDAQKLLFAPSKSLFPQSCVSTGGSMAGLMVTSSNRAYAVPISRCTQSPCSRPLLTFTSKGDTQTQFWLSLWGLGMRFVSFLGLSCSDDQVLGQCTGLGRPCVLVTSLVQAAVSRVYLESTASGVLNVSSGELISGCDPPGRCQPSRISGRRG